MMLRTFRACIETARRVRFRIREAAYDRRTGVETRGYLDLNALDIDPAKIDGVARNGNGAAYQPTPAWMLETILGKLNLDWPRFLFLDLGSGLGRAVLMASAFPFAAIVGIEISPKLHAAALRNLANYKGGASRRSNIRLLCMDALDYELPPVNTVIYMFNPFNGEVMAAMLVRLGASLRRHPREVYVIYLNPTRKDLLEAAGWLTPVAAHKYYRVYRAKA